MHTHARRTIAWYELWVVILCTSKRNIFLLFFSILLALLLFTHMHNYKLFKSNHIDKMKCLYVWCISLQSQFFFIFNESNGNFVRNNHTVHTEQTFLIWKWKKTVCLQTFCEKIELVLKSNTINNKCNVAVQLDIMR